MDFCDVREAAAGIQVRDDELQTDTCITLPDTSQYGLTSIEFQSTSTNATNEVRSWVDPDQRQLDAIKADRVSLLHRVQELQIAMNTNRAETEIIELRNVELQDSLNICRERVTELENQVFENNLRRSEHDDTFRNYDAALGRLSRLETENRMLTEDRSKYLEEATSYCQQSRELTVQNDQLKDRIDDQNRALKILGEEKKEKETEIKKLRTHLEQKRGSPGFAYAVSSGGLQPRNSNRFTVESVNLEQRDAVTRSCEDDEYTCTTESLRKRGRFSTEPSTIPWCRNCMSVFSVVSNKQSTCRFHRLEPQSFSVWRHYLEKRRYSGLSVTGLKYWACCDVLAHREPPGCMILRHHDIHYPQV